MNSDYHKHHRKRRSQGGSGFWGNMIELPAEVHALVHEHPEVAYEHGLLVKSHDDPNMIRPDVRGFMAALGYEFSEKPKRKNFPKDSEERRKRKRITIAVPNDTEDGGALWDEMLEHIKDRLIERGRYNPGQKIPAYEALMLVFYDWLTTDA